jgi:hypothetical protein
MFRCFFTTIFRGSSAVLCAITFLPADLRSLSLCIQTQRTKISGKDNGTKHGRGPLEDGREKRPKHVGVLYLQTRFYHFIGFKC